MRIALIALGLAACSTPPAMPPSALDPPDAATGDLARMPGADLAEPDRLTQAPDLARAADLAQVAQVYDLSPAPDLDPPCGGPNEPCCAGGGCWANFTCMYGKDQCGAATMTLCYPLKLPAICGVWTAPCCDANGQPIPFAVCAMGYCSKLINSVGVCSNYKCF